MGKIPKCTLKGTLFKKLKNYGVPFSPIFSQYFISILSSVLTVL